MVIGYGDGILQMLTTISHLHMCEIFVPEMQLQYCGAVTRFITIHAKQFSHKILFSNYSVFKSQNLNLLSASLDGVLKVDFLFHPTIHSLRHLNHNKLFNFALLCLWNVQIQFQFWCWLS